MLGAIKPFGDALGDNLRVLGRSDAYKGDGTEGQTTTEAYGRVFVVAKALRDCVRAIALLKSFSGPGTARRLNNTVIAYLRHNEGVL